MVLDTLFIFTGCAVLLVPGGQKTSSSSLTSMFLYSQNVPGLALTYSRRKWKFGKYGGKGSGLRLLFSKYRRMSEFINFMNNKPLSFKMEKTAFYIVAGFSFSDISAKVGTSSRSIFRWLKLPEMQSRIRELRRITIEHSTNDLLRLNKKAVQTLESLLDCTSSPAARCRAASIILTKTTESLEYEYESRLKAIEQRYNEEK
jgi:hypothetical protein